MQALTGLPAGDLCSIENPSIETLTEYFSEYSIASKAYCTQGEEDPLFREVAWVLIEYGFVHHRPPTMPKNKVSFIIATYEGLKVDWLVIVTDSLRATIHSIEDGKKASTAVAQWLSLLVSLPLAIQARKRGRSTETTPNKTTKRQQLLAKHTPGWTEGGSSQ